MQVRGVRVHGDPVVWVAFHMLLNGDNLGAVAVEDLELEVLVVRNGYQGGFEVVHFETFLAVDGGDEATRPKSVRLRRAAQSHQSRVYFRLAGVLIHQYSQVRLVHGQAAEDDA